MSFSYSSIAHLALVSAAFVMPFSASATIHHPVHHSEPARAIAVPSHVSRPPHSVSHSSGQAAHYNRASGAHLRRASLTYHRYRSYERFTGNSFVEGDPTTADITAGEDPIVRAAAIAALGNMNGTALCDRSQQWPHPGDGESDTRPEWRGRAVLDYQGFGGPCRSSGRDHH